jgi:hypothetical protein
MNNGTAQTGFNPGLVLRAVVFVTFLAWSVIEHRDTITGMLDASPAVIAAIILLPGRMHDRQLAQMMTEQGNAG